MDENLNSSHVTDTTASNRADVCVLSSFLLNLYNKGLVYPGHAEVMSYIAVLTVCFPRSRNADSTRNKHFINHCESIILVGS